jgi:membrane protein implicated in regulation of membrane protease activity
VFVRGELWRARAADRIIPGEHVQVDALDGLTLDVHRIDT